MTEQEMRLLGKVIAAEINKGGGRSEAPRYSDHMNSSEINSEIELLNAEAKKISDLSLSSSFKKYGAEVIGALKYGKDLHEAMRDFTENLKKISDTATGESKKYADTLINLISASKISAQEILQLTFYMQEFEKSIVDGTGNSKEYATEISKITQKYADLDKVVKGYTDRTKEARKETDKETRRQKVESESILKTTQTIGSIFSQHYHRTSEMLAKQMENIPAMLFSRIRKGIVGGAKITLDAMQAQIKYNVPVSTFAENLGRLNLSEADAAQAISENRFGFRMLGGKNNAMGGFGNLTSSASLSNALLQYAPQGGAERLKALEQRQSNLANFGMNYGKTATITGQLNTFKNLARSVGLTDAGLQEFTSSLVNSGAIATIEANRKFKNSKEEEKYMAKELKERMALARALGMSSQQMATMQAQGVSNQFMGVREYIMNRYVKPQLLAAQAGMVGMHMTRRQIKAVAMYNTGNIEQRQKYAPTRIATMAEYFAALSKSKGISGHVLQSQVGMSSEAIEMANQMNRVIGTFVTIADKNQRAANILGIKQGDTLTQKRRRIETYYSKNLNDKNNPNFQYLQSLMAKEGGTSAKPPSRSTMGIHAQTVNLYTNMLASLEKNPFGALLAGLGDLALSLGKDYFLMRLLNGTLGSLPSEIGTAISTAGTSIVEALGGGAALGTGALAAGAVLGVGGIAALSIHHNIGEAQSSLEKLKNQKINYGGNIERLKKQYSEMRKHYTDYTYSDYSLSVAGGRTMPYQPYNNPEAVKYGNTLHNLKTAIADEEQKIKAFPISKRDFSKTFTLDGKTENIGTYMENLIKNPKINEKQMEELLKKIELNTKKTAAATHETNARQKIKDMTENSKNSPQALAMRHARHIVAGISSYRSQYQNP
jgi:hypothetical protein